MSLKNLIAPSDTTPLLRSQSLALDEILNQLIPMHIHGFIKVVDYMGNDESIVNAARMSYGAGTRSARDTPGLINYLLRHNHTSPFEMCEIKLHVRLPIFVMRQWVRHRMASLNEYSARYSVMKDEFFIPPVATVRKQSQMNKQGGDELFLITDAIRIQEEMVEANEEDFELYMKFLADDLSRETARNILPVNIYTEMVWKIDLHNLFHFLKLRDHSHAQETIREYAAIIDTIVSEWVPLAHSAFLNYRKHALNFSLLEQRLLRQMLSRYELDGTEEGTDIMSKRELKEFQEKLNSLPVPT